MEITEPRRLYQQLAADLKERIEQGVYLVGDKLPAERFIADEKNVSRTVVREAIIMLEVEGYVEVRTRFRYSCGFQPAAPSAGG
ncbi:hypothetical protein VEE15_38710 [Escherichia coli]|nr:hypothetical protein VEE15_38710 [Escherichia coli]